MSLDFKIVGCPNCSETEYILFRLSGKLCLYCRNCEYAGEFETQYNKSYTEVSKLKLFMEVFSSLQGHEKNDISETILIHDLIKTTKFDKKEAKEYIKKAMMNGQIYERRSGWYTKA